MIQTCHCPQNVIVLNNISLFTPLFYDQNEKTEIHFIMESFNQENKVELQKTYLLKRNYKTSYQIYTEALHRRKEKGADKQVIREEKAEQQKPKTVSVVVTFAILIGPFKIIIMNLVIIWSVPCYSNKFVNEVRQNILNYEG